MNDDNLKRKKILMACGVYWNSPIQLGDHHIANKFVEAGWDVAYISTPVSLLHIFSGITPELRDRFNIYRSGGIRNRHGLWSYVPGALFIPQNKPLLRNKWVYNNWQKFTCPNVVNVVTRHGFAEVDILYITEPRQVFWFNTIKRKMSVYRCGDKSSSFSWFNDEMKKAERFLIRSADLVLYSAQGLKSYVDGMGAKRTLYFPNGVNFPHFADANKTVPEEFKNIQKPMVIYVGALDYWFDYDVVNFAVNSLPGVSFVIIGPGKLANKRLNRSPNLHILGTRSHNDIPAYLYHADIGIIPFNISEYPELINCVNPLKLYEYMACGLPVVATEWKEIKNINSPALLYRTKEEFVQKIKESLATRPDKASYINFAEKQDWKKRFGLLEDALKTTLYS